MPTPITAPYSLQLRAYDDSKDAVAGTVVTVVSNHMKIFLGSAVDPGKRQQYVGSLKACYRTLMAELGKRQNATDQVAYGPAYGASDGNIIVTTDTLSVGATDVALVVSSSFTSDRSHELTETFNQLINALLQNTAAN